MNKPCSVRSDVRPGVGPGARSLRAGTIASAVTALFAASCGPAALANPTGAQVVSGTVSVAVPGAGQMNITQSSPKAIVNWNTFSIGASEGVKIVQPSASAALLNRVMGNDASVIAGRLQANGKVFLVNPAGVIFAPGSSVNVGSLVASTLNISNADFLVGNYRFVGASAAPVSNAGTLTAGSGGTIALLGGTVSNTGTVSARLGTVALGAGSDITVDFAGDGLTTLKINAGAARALIGNTGTLAADGGTVLMSAQTADALAGTVINQQGIVRAQSVAERNGRIVLDGGTNGVVMAGGTLDATGGAGLTGGRVDVTGYDVALPDGARVDASGAAGGGTVRFGGGAAGGDADIRNANAIWMSPGASIHADASQSGNGGHVVAYSATTSRIYGTLSAKGGAQGGNGGLIETSGHYLDTAGVKIDASAVKGRAGTWLLDPFDVFIQPDPIGLAAITAAAAPGSTTTFAATSDNSVVFRSDIETPLGNGTSVTITTGTGGAQAGNISIQTRITKTALSPAGNNATTLTFSAAGSITDNGQDITSQAGPLNLVFDANVGGATPANSVRLTNVAIDTNGGSLTIGDAGQSAVIINNSTVHTEAGAITITGAAEPEFHGIAIGYSLLATTSGNVTLAGSSTFGNGIDVQQGAIETASGAISLSGSGSAGLFGGSAFGVNISGGPYAQLNPDESTTLIPNIDATGSGTVTINGVITGSTSGSGVNLNNAQLAAATGNVALTGSADVTNQGAGVTLQSATISTTGGRVSITGSASASQAVAIGYAATGLASGVALGYALVSTGDGSISVTGSSSLSGLSTLGGVGVDIEQSALRTTGQGSIAVTGTAGSTATGPATGVIVNGNFTNQAPPGTTPALSATGAGAISVNGNAQAMTGTGLSVNNATFTAASGAIGMAGTATVSNTGDGADFTSTLISAGAGNVTISGSANVTLGGSGVVLDDTSMSTTSGNVSVNGAVNGATAFGSGVGTFGAFLVTNADNTVTQLPLIVTGSGNIIVAGSTPATTSGSIAFDLNNGSISSTSGAISLSGRTTGTPATNLTSTGVVLESLTESTVPTPSTVTTGSGQLSIDGSGSGANAQGVLIADGTRIASNDGGAIDIRGVVTSPTTRANGGNVQFDYGTLLLNGSVSSTKPGSTISLAGSTNTSDAGLAFGAVPMPPFMGSLEASSFFHAAGPVSVNGAPNGSVVLRAANDNTSQSILSRSASVAGGGGVLSILPASVNPSTFALTPQDATPITLFGTSGGMSIDAQTFASFTNFQTLTLGSDTQTGLITVNGVCGSASGACQLVKPGLNMNLALSNPGAGSQGIQLPFGLSLGAGHTLALVSAGAVTDPGGIQAANLLLSGPGSFTLTDPQNDVGVLALVNAGNVNFVDSHGFAIGPVTSPTYNATSGTLTTIDGTHSTLTGNLIAQAATGNIALNTSLTSSGTVDLVMENGVFTARNSGALSATNGWRIWAATWNQEVRGNVQPNTAQPNFYGCVFGAGCSWGGTVPTTGNHYVYASRPTVTVTANGATRIAGAPNPAFTFTANGLINGDTAAGALTGSLTTPANQNSLPGQYPIDPNFLSSVGYVVNEVPATLTVITPPNPVAQAGLQSFFSNQEQTFVYENNLQGTNICIGSNQPLFTTATPGDNQDILAVEWKRVRSQPNLNSCMLLNSPHGCGDF
ncbi:filamentous hemagglutinin family N-terminal domain-containing protein [Paraburkholderia diazotrophica]|uniref:Filamentous hemagglutinin family N-terminal domain-containing protein n=1 Tax=Paraburkholderia diazotrophica TaxID=667676 RepID=A0A1H6WPJ0_9BURK|nr:filamentous hemagglutinin N-terminal domain-containing protein [Paraburkholderia diazotrophica]SEJ18798.1 filamentous hemagglutinin family N-terminal domain-containing protein [Paraburkholderia diazotrophica]